MKYLNTKTVLSLALALQTQFASADFSPVTIICQSNGQDSSIRLKGEFREVPHQHGQGQVIFYASIDGTSIQGSGIGQAWSVDAIEYNDNSIQALFMDSNNYSVNVSWLKINGQSHSMVCQFKSAEESVCTSWACHHNGH
ncbi:MAG: hypothetical protein ACXVCY_14220 [Pseudobdellovibrionaceae bacterium]